jgi:hypothetical protein
MGMGYLYEIRAGELRIVPALRADLRTRPLSVRLSKLKAAAYWRVPEACLVSVVHNACGMMVPVLEHLGSNVSHFTVGSS